MVVCFRLPESPLWPCDFGLVHAVDDDGQHAQHSIVVLVPACVREITARARAAGQQNTNVKWSLPIS